MENLIVEEGPCSINRIIIALANSSTFSEVGDTWSTLALYLDTPQVKVKELRDHFRLGFRNFHDILRSLLLNWKARRGSSANMHLFCEYLDKTGLRDSVETLEREFSKEVGQVEEVPFQRNRKRNEPFSESSDRVTSSQKHPRTQTFSTPPKGISELLHSKNMILIISTSNLHLTCEKILETVPDVIKCQFDDIFSYESTHQIPLLHLQIPNTEIDWELLLEMEMKCILVTEARKEMIPIIEADNERIKIFEDTTKWKDLTPQFRLKLMTKLKKELGIEQFPNLNYSAKEELIIDLVQGRTPPLWRDTILPDLKYYVGRTLVTRNIISRDDICTDVDCKDVFVIQGLQWHQLSTLTKGKGADSSESQLEKISITSTFISLDHPSHFERICARANNRTVHLMTVNEDKNFVWIRTKGDIDFVQKHVKRTLQKHLNEIEFIKEIESQNSGEPIILSDTPGMGKSVLLAKIGRELERTHPNRKIIFLVISEFVRSVKSGIQSGRNKKDEIVRALCNHACDNELGEAVLKKKLNSEDYPKVELLFDGFDEIHGDDQQLALDILKIIILMKSIRLWVTTRPHLLLTLEKELNVLGYNIAPFTEPNQIQFFSQFWSQMKPGLDLDRLKSYSRECLKSLRSKISQNSKQEDIAGIPLQCLLIGEVFSEDAVAYAEYKFKEACVRISSITDLYALLVDKKFQTYFSRYNRSSTFNSDTLTEIMVTLSIKLLLPQISVSLEFCQVTLNELLNLGILLERSTFDMPRFIHRTFAEYFVALYLKEKVNDNDDQSRYNQILFEAVDVFHDKSVSLGKLNGEQFYHPVIVYLLDILLEDGKTQLEVPWSYEFDSKIDGIGRMCLQHDTFNVFKFLGGVPWIGDQFRAIFTWKSDLETCVEVCRLEYVQMACELFETLTGNTLKSLVVDEKFGLNGEPFLKALKRGERTIVEYLLDRHGFDEVLNQGHGVFSTILEKCVVDSKGDSDRIVEDKIQIIRKILNEDWAVMRRSERSLLYGVNGHVRLLLELVRIKQEKGEFGQDPDDYIILWNLSSSWDDDTVLEFLHELKKILPLPTFEKLFTHENPQSFPSTNVIHTYKFLRKYDHEIWEIMRNHKTDFNLTDKLGNSTLFLAIRYQCDVATLKKLVAFGANPFYTNEGKTALHKAALNGTPEVIQYFLELGLKINEKCDKGKTPLDYFLQRSGNTLDTGYCLIQNGAEMGGGKTPNEIFLDLCKANKFALMRFSLEELGADIDARDKDGNTALHIWLKDIAHWDHSDAVEYLIKKGADVNAQNNDGDMPYSININLESEDQDGVPAFHVLLFAQRMESSRFVIEKLTSLIWKLLTQIKKPDPLILRSIIEKFMELGGDINNKNEEGFTWSHQIITEGMHHHLKIFIDLGADMNARDCGGNTVLHALMAHDRYKPEDISKVAEYLLNKREDVIIDAKNDSEETPFLCGLKKETIWPIKPSLVRLFEARGQFHGLEVARYALTWAIILDEKEMSDEEFQRIVGKCEDLGADIQEVDEDDGWTLLHSAAYCVIHRSVKYLLQRGLDGNAKNHDGNTPLNLVANEFFEFRDSMKVMKTLLEAGAGIFTENNDDVAPLDSLSRHSNCLNYLLKTRLMDCVNQQLPIRLVCSSIRFGDLKSIKLACRWLKERTGMTVMEYISEGRNDIKDNFLQIAIDRYNFEGFRYLVHLQGLKEELSNWKSFLKPTIPSFDSRDLGALEDLKIYCSHHNPNLEFSNQ